jgi:tetratricopeptide (TPR) repeat protein
MSDKKIPLAALIAAFVLMHFTQSTQAQAPYSPTTLAYNIQDDMLKCYQGLGKGAETEHEFQWLLSQKPGNALYHYNYAVFLRNEAKYATALPEYEKAAAYDGSNVDYVGQCGQMFFFMKNYKKAYQYLGKAVQMPGGEKYKASFEACQKYLQDQAVRVARQAIDRAKKQGKKPGGAPGADDDD